MLRNIYIIINPASGNDEPILSYINDNLKTTNLKWDIAITKKTGDAFNLAREALALGFDAIAVYGGDGTIMEVSQALFNQKTPLFIIPGGTANVMAKELNIPTDTEEALNLLSTQNLSEKYIDMGIVENHPFLIRVSFGLPADVVNETDRSIKDKLGMGAYLLTGFKRLLSQNKQSYKIVLDNETIETEGIALVVANSGHLGMSNMFIAPDILIDDGLLDVMLVTESDIKSLISITTSTLTQKPTHAVKQWKSKSVSVIMTPSQQATLDDLPIKLEEYNFKVVPNALKVLVPLNNATNN